MSTPSQLWGVHVSGVCYRWMDTHLRPRSSELQELRRPERSSPHRNTAHHLQEQSSIETHWWWSHSGPPWVNHMCSVLTSQDGCDDSGQQAAGIDRHVENGEEFLPLAGLEGIKRRTRRNFFGKGRKHRNMIALICTELTVFYGLTTHTLFFDAFISLNLKKKCGVSHAPRRTGLLQTLPHRVWFLQCRRRWVSAQPWTEHCNTRIHSKCSFFVLKLQYKSMTWLVHQPNII